jgi:hypothetical protein
MSARASAGIGVSEGLSSRQDRHWDEVRRKRRVRKAGLKTASAKADKTHVNSKVSESTKRRLSAKKKKK